MRAEKWVGLMSLLLIAGLSYALRGLFFSAPRQVERPLDTLFIGTTMPQTRFSIASQDGAFGRMNYNAFVQAKLVDLDENNDVMPDMATSWEISEDNRSLTFTLADGIRWHDGTLLTREDMEFTFALLRKNPSSSVSRFIEWWSIWTINGFASGSRSRWRSDFYRITRILSPFIPSISGRTLRFLPNIGGRTRPSGVARTD